jgi:hypothetical protein
MLSQLDGPAMVSVIEADEGWWNVIVETGEISSDLSVITGPNEVIVDGKLGEHAVGAAEDAFLAGNEVTALGPAVFYVSPTDGYHSSSALIGMCHADDVFVIRC